LDIDASFPHPLLVGFSSIIRLPFSVVKRF